LLLKTQLRLTPLLLQPPFPLLRETVKLSPLLIIFTQPLLVNAHLLLFLLFSPLLCRPLLIMTLLSPINLLLPLCL
jgi:hypothetical protein